MTWSYWSLSKCIALKRSNQVVLVNCVFQRELIYGTCLLPKIESDNLFVF